MLIDDADLPLLDGRTWYVATTRLRSGRSYQHALSVARRGEKAAAPVRMHRLIMGVSDPKVLVDHINRNPLDNRRANLRLASKSQNTANGRAWGKSKYRGVTWDKDNSRWRAAVFKNGRRIHIGRFDTEEEAARAYDAVAREHHAEFAALNFSAAKRPLQSHQRDTARHKPARTARSNRWCATCAPRCALSPSCVEVARETP